MMETEMPSTAPCTSPRIAISELTTGDFREHLNSDRLDAHPNDPALLEEQRF